MTEDIVARLRDKWRHSEEDCYEAADEIGRLRGEVERITNMLYGVKGEVSTLGVIEEAASFFNGWSKARAQRDAALARAEAAERERDWHKALTQIHDMLADNATQKARAEAAEAKVAKLREALTETLAIATRNEEGQFAERARAVLQETEQ